MIDCSKGMKIAPVDEKVEYEDFLKTSNPVVNKLAMDAFHDYIAEEIDNGGIKTTMRYNQ